MSQVGIKQSPMSLLSSLGLLLGCAVMAGFAGICLSQAHAWDFLNYHFYVAHAYLNHRMMHDVAPAGLQTYLNPLLHVPFYYLITVLNEKPRLIQFTIGAVQGINIYLVFLIARVIFSGQSRFLGFCCVFGAVTIGASGTAMISELGTSIGDNVLSILILSAIFTVIRTDQRGLAGRVTAGLLSAGLLVGVAAGLKLTNLVYLMGLLFAAAVQQRRMAPLWQPMMVFAIAAGVGFLAAGWAWMWKLYSMFQNPFFPFLNEIFKSPFCEVFDYSDKRFLPRDIPQTLFYPFYWLRVNADLVTEVPFRDARFAAVISALLILPLSALFRRLAGSHSSIGPDIPRDAANRSQAFVLVFWMSSYLLWLRTFAIYRYGVVLELISGIIIVWAIRLMIDTERWAAGAILLAVTLLVVTTVYPKWGWNWPTRFETGRYLSVDVPELPSGSLVLLIGNDAMTYLIPFFEPDIRFVGVDFNFVRHGENNLLQKKIEATIARHAGPIFGMYYQGMARAESAVSEILAGYKLGRDEASCRFVISNADKFRPTPSIKICGLRRLGLP